MRDVEDTTHYHVMSGLRGGYLPNNNDVALTMKDARSSMRFWRDVFREDGERVRGSIKDGFMTVGEHEYLEITSACYDIECLNHEARERGYADWPAWAATE